MIKLLISLARRNIQQYVEVSEILGEFLPTLHGIQIVRVPRAEIEKSFLEVYLKVMYPGSQIPKAIIGTLPRSEYTLVETWERVQGDLLQMPYPRYKQVYEDMNFQSAMRNFSSKCLKLLLEKSIMLDMCWNGIYYRDPNKRRLSQVTTIDMLLSLLENRTEELLLQPRNVAYDTSIRKLSFYDLNPVFRIGTFVKSGLLEDLVHSVRNRDHKNIRIVANKHPEAGVFSILSYLVLIDIYSR